MPETIPLHRSMFGTDETSEAAAFMSIGVPFADTREPATGKILPPIVTTRTADHPRGVTQYMLAGSSPGGVKCADLRASWRNREADIEFDDLLNRLETAIAGNVPAIKVMRKIRSRFPHMLVAYFRGFADNRSRLIDLRNKGTKLNHYKRGETGFVLISANASDETRAHCGLPPRGH